MTLSSILAAKCRGLSRGALRGECGFCGNLCRASESCLLIFPMSGMDGCCFAKLPRLLTEKRLTFSCHLGTSRRFYTGVIYARTLCTYVPKINPAIPPVRTYTAKHRKTHLYSDGLRLQFP